MLILASHDTRLSEPRGHAVAWLHAMRGPQPGTFRFGTESPVCLMGAVCAALAAEVLDARRLRDADRDAWAETIRAHQRDDGWFEDPLLATAGSADHSPEYLLAHQTFLATMALDALDAAPARPLAFIDAWRDDQAVYERIDRLSWTDPWSDSNWVEWIGYFLLADAGLRPVDVPLPRDRWPAGFGGVMQWLIDHVDRDTGFWGNPPLDEPWRSLYLMAGAYHHYVFFYATETPIPAIEHVIDTTLRLQQPGGLFRPDQPGGGPCDDLDAIDILANMTRLTDYRRPEILAALADASRAILAGQRRNGAFVWSHNPEETPSGSETARVVLSPNPRTGPRARWRALRRYRHQHLGPRMRYAGSPGLRFFKAGGDMYSQWFRPLALAIAAQVLPADRRPVQWDFGFHNQITQGWWPGSKS